MSRNSFNSIGMNYKRLFLFSWCCDCFAAQVHDAGLDGIDLCFGQVTGEAGHAIGLIKALEHDIVFSTGTYSSDRGFGPSQTQPAGSCFKTRTEVPVDIWGQLSLRCACKACPGRFSIERVVVVRRKPLTCVFPDTWN